MATAAQITTLLGALKHDIGAFQTQLEETWSKVKDETKPIWAGEDNKSTFVGGEFGDSVTRLNANFQLKAYIQTNRDLKIFEKALAEIETLRAVAAIDSNQNKANVYRLVNTMLKFYTTVQQRLTSLRDKRSWESQWWTRASTVFKLTTDAKTAIGAEADVGEDPAKQQEIQTYAHNIELKAYATLIRSALDRAIQQLQDRKTKPASWWGQASAQDRERKRAAADTLLTDKTITGIYALQFIAKQQETNPNQLYITWLFQKINLLYRANWDLFVRLRGDVLKTETFKYVYNQVPIIGWIGLRPSSQADLARPNATIAAGVIAAGNATISAEAGRDPSLRQYNPIPIDQIPQNPTIQGQFPEAVKAADAVPKSATTTAAPGAATAPATAPGAAPGAAPATAPGGAPATAPGATPATAPGGAPGATPTTGALSTEDVDALIKLDGQEGTDVFFYGVRPIKLPPGDLPTDWKERPAYRAIADQLNLINHASQHKKEAGWIDTIFKEIGLGCTSDRQIMFSTKCPTFRTYLEELALQMLDMGAFQFISPETPNAASYGSVAITITAKFSALMSALTADAELLQADESLRPLLVQIRDLETFIKSLNPTPISTPDLTAINTILADLTKDLTALGITI